MTIEMTPTDAMRIGYLLEKVGKGEIESVTDIKESAIRVEKTIHESITNLSSDLKEALRFIRENGEV